MDTIIIIVAVVAVVLLGALLATYMARRRRRRDALGMVSGTVAVRPLPDSARHRFTAEWTNVQSEFQQDPDGAVQHADQLVRQVMTERGYPTVTFEQAADEIASTTSPRVVENYRYAHAVALADTRGRASDEDLEEAMQRFRVLFYDLLEDAPA